MMENEDPSAWKGRVSPNDFQISSASDQIGGARPQETLISQEANSSVQSAANAADAERRSDAEHVPGVAPSGYERTVRVHRHKPGPKRRNFVPNPFGRYALSSAVKKYLEATQNYYAPSTQAERARKIRYIASQIVALGAAPTPRNWNQANILAFTKWMQTKGLDNRTQRKYLQFLADYLAFYSNPVLTNMLSKKVIRKPSAPEKEIRTLPEEAIHLIHNATLTMKGWEGAVARFITLAYPYTGLRPSELRRIKYADVDTANWTLTVSHPKGEKSYGQKRTVGILPLIRQAFAEFLEARRDFLAQHNLPETFEPLIPYQGRYAVTYWPHQAFILLKMKIERAAGIQFKLKDYRSSYCQLAIDRGADLSAVSKTMGHKTTKTTELYYGRIKDQAAIKEIERAFSEPNARNSNIPCTIKVLGSQK